MKCPNCGSTMEEYEDGWMCPNPNCYQERYRKLRDWGWSHKDAKAIIKALTEKVKP